jgi:hypothetical protein
MRRFDVGRVGFNKVARGKTCSFEIFGVGQREDDVVVEVTFPTKRRLATGTFHGEQFSPHSMEISTSATFLRLTLATGETIELESASLALLADKGDEFGVHFRRFVHDGAASLVTRTFRVGATGCSRDRDGLIAVFSISGVGTQESTKMLEVSLAGNPRTMVGSQILDRADDVASMSFSESKDVLGFY